MGRPLWAEANAVCSRTITALSLPNCLSATINQACHVAETCAPGEDVLDESGLRMIPRMTA